MPFLGIILGAVLGKLWVDANIPEVRGTRRRYYDAVASDSNEKVSGWLCWLIVGLIPWLVYLLLDYYGFIAWMKDGNTAVSVAFAVWKWLAITEVIIGGISVSVKIYCYIRKPEDTTVKKNYSLNDAFFAGFIQLFLCILAILFLTHWGWFVGFVLSILAGFGHAADE